MKLEQIEKKIERAKKELQELGPIRPGSLSKQYSVCGKPGCRCADKIRPQKHGPYFQLSYVDKGKSTTQFIRPQFVTEIKTQLLNYKRFRKLVDDWTQLSIEYSRQRLEDLKRLDSK